LKKTTSEAWISKENVLIMLQVVVVMFLLTVAFALLIWYDNPIDAVKLAQVSSGSYVNDYCLLQPLSLFRGFGIGTGSSKWHTGRLGRLLSKEY
jgi:hypothetical protein